MELEFFNLLLLLGKIKDDEKNPCDSISLSKSFCYLHRRKENIISLIGIL